MTLTPAYGRDYKTKKEVLEAWNTDKDFQVADLFSGRSGSYTNRADLVGMNHKGFITIRYSRLTKVLAFKL